MPHRTSVAQPWRLQQERYRLAGRTCDKCGNIDFPARRLCGECGWLEGKEIVLSGSGIVETFTVIHTAPEGFEHQTPYAIGLVRMNEGPVITAQITGDIEGIMIGKKVRAVFRKLYEYGDAGMIHYGFKFELLSD